MRHSVFIDKIGKIFDGNREEAIENFERYRDFSQQGVGIFSNKNVYLLDSNDNIVNSYGITKFADGGGVKESKDYVKDFLLNKNIDNNGLSDFKSLRSDDSSVLIYKNENGEFPLISRKKNTAVFHKKNFSSNDYINNMESRFKEFCIKNAISFEIK